MGTTFASELLRELSNSQIDEFFSHTKSSFEQRNDDLLNFSEFDAAYVDEDSDEFCHTDNVELMTYSDITS